VFTLNLKCHVTDSIYLHEVVNIGKNKWHFPDFTK